MANNETTHGRAQDRAKVAGGQDHEDGEMVPAWEPREMPDERRAVAAAKLAAATHAAAIAWKRTVRPDRGEFGEPEVLFTHGPVPDLD